MDLIRSIQGRRKTRIDREGSPYFDLYPASIAAGISQNYDIDQYSELAESRKYAPLDYIQVINTDSVALELRLKSQRHYIPAGAIISLTDEAIWGFQLKNMDVATATTAGKIHIVLQRQPLSEDKAIRRKV